MWTLQKDTDLLSNFLNSLLVSINEMMLFYPQHYYDIIVNIGSRIN